MTDDLTIDEKQKIELRIMIQKGIDSGILGMVKTKSGKVAYYVKQED
jgi:hypothetical protein